MNKVYVKLEGNGIRRCFVVDTDRTAHDLDHNFIRPFVQAGIEVTCLRKYGANKYGWAADAEK